MRRLGRRLAQGFAAVGVLLLLLACLGAGALWLTLPNRTQEARIEGLSAPVDIGFDQDGIPRIRAATALDAAAALGFVHARDRMFQMELMRRSASGRLSELVGSATLGLDRMMRTLGLRRRATEDLPRLPAETRAMLDAYARGVNAWIGARGRFAAPEFLVLGAPEPWQPVDSLLWGKIMGMWLSYNWRTELTRLGLQGHVPMERIAELWAASLRPLPADALLATPRRFAAAADGLDRMLPRWPDPFTRPPSASNEWAVDGRHTATGAPLLAGDPHLEFGQPGVWYLARIEMPGHVLVGATGPGVPFLVIGHNGRIAWTFTTNGADVQDIFVETPAGDGYQTPDGPRPFTTREERIGIRGEPDQVLTVRETRHGPVVSDLAGNGQALMAVAMANLQPGDTAAAGLLALNQAGTVAEARQAAALISSPVQNLLVADRQGIALFVTGRVPVRKAGDGFAPVAGADGAHDWTGFAAGDELPSFVAPASGRLVNTNEPLGPSGSTVYVGRDAYGDWRARRVREMLAQSDRLTAADMARMQVDVQSSFARQVLPALLTVSAGGDRADAVPAGQPAASGGSPPAREAPQQPAAASPASGGPLASPASGASPTRQGTQPPVAASPAAGAPSASPAAADSPPPREASGTQPRPDAQTVRKALEMLQGWDGAMTTDAPQPLIFNAWMLQFYRSVLSAAGIRPDQGGPRSDFVAFVLSPAGAHWCNGDCRPLLRESLRIALQSLTDEYGSDPSAWRWGTAHQVFFRHPILGRLPLLGPLTTASIAAPGDDTTVDRGAPNADLQDVQGASFRGVYDLADLDASLFVMTPGQSGNILSGHTRDFIARWRDGATVRLGPQPARTEATLHLIP